MHVLLLILALAPSQVGPASPPQGEVPRADVALVCPEEFLETLHPWLVLRQEQGHRFLLVANTYSADAIRAAIQREAAHGRLRHVVIVGNAPPHAARNAGLRPRCVPTHYAAARVNVHWGSEPEIATDNPYGDISGDGIPNLTVGRISADSAEQLALILQKILAYERSNDMGLWRRQIHFVAGAGGFGPIADSVIEMTARRLITDGVPPGYATTMTYGSWRSPFCPDPRRFHQQTMDRLAEGALLWVYMGHGHRTSLQPLSVPGADHHVLAARDPARLQLRGGAPIAVLLACYTGAFDGAEDCLAEEMLRAPGGPVAVFAGSRVTMPYAMSVLGTAMLEEFFSERGSTLGDLVLAAKRRTMEEDQERTSTRRLLDALAGAVSPSRELLPQERAEHLALFNLLGDPLLRIRRPQPVRLQLDSAAVGPGSRATITGESPIEGMATIELVCRRDRTTFVPPLRPRFDASDAALAQFDEVYRRANDPRWASTEMRVARGPFRAEITVPEDAVGPSHVRVYIAGDRDFALGAADLDIRRAGPHGSQPDGFLAP